MLLLPPLLLWCWRLCACSMSCVLRASDAEKSVGSPIASSNELVWRDWVPPITAASASIVVRITLLYGSCGESVLAVILLLMAMDRSRGESTSKPLRTDDDNGGGGNNSARLRGE